MASVFLSYAREDRSIAEQIATLLHSHGISVWWDRDMIAGADIHTVVDSELSRSQVVVVLWSPHSVTSHWVRGEAQTALDEEKLVPVKVAQCKVPINFRHFHTPEIYLDKAELQRFASMLSVQLRAKDANKDEPKPIEFKKEAQERFLDLVAKINADMSNADTRSAMDTLGKRHPGFVNAIAAISFIVLVLVGIGCAFYAHGSIMSLVSSTPPGQLEQALRSTSWVDNTIATVMTNPLTTSIIAGILAGVVAGSISLWLLLMGTAKVSRILIGIRRKFRASATP